VLTEGVAGGEFSLVDFTASPPAVKVAFHPVFPGLRRGAVVLRDTSTTPPGVVASVPLFATGDGPLAMFAPTAPTATLATGITPVQVVRDGAGNQYLANGGAGNVLFLPGGAPQLPAPAVTATVLIAGPTPGDIEGVALDGAGNLFYSDPANGKLWVSPGLGTGTPQVVTFSGASPTRPTRLATDRAGNLYVLDAGANRCLQATPVLSAGIWTAAGSVLFPQTGTSCGFPWGPFIGLAVDPQQNVYLTDGSARVLRVPATGNPAPLSLPAGMTLTACTGVGADPVGNLYLADAIPEGETRILCVTQGLPAPGALAPLGALFTQPGKPITSLTPDGFGNVLVPDPDLGRLVRIMAGWAPALAPFPDTGVNAFSPAQTVVLTNLGNAGMPLGSAFALPPDFILAPGGEPPSVLSPARSASLSIQFHPTTTGPLAETLGVPDHEPFQSPQAFAILVSGQGTSSLGTALALSSSGNPAPPSAPVTFTAHVSYPPGHPAPTGPVAFFDGAVSLGSGSLDVAGLASLTTADLVPGPHAITAVYAGDDIYAGASSPGLAQAIESITSVTLASSDTGTGPEGLSLTFTARVAPGAGPGSLPSGRSGAPALALAAVASGNVDFLDNGALVATVALADGVASYSTAALTEGRHVITARYDGDADDQASTSNPVTEQVGPPALTLAVTGGARTVSAGGSVTVQLTLTSTEPLKAVTLAIAGLPSGASCPLPSAGLDLTSGSATVPLTISTSPSLHILGGIQGTGPNRPWWGLGTLALTSVLLAVLTRTRRHPGIAVAALALGILLVGFSTSCFSRSGSNGNAGTPAGTYPITFTAASPGATSGTAKVQLTVTP
jgi:hypothetical protein